MNLKDIFKKNSKKHNDVQPEKPVVHRCSLCGAPETEVPIIIRGGEDTYVCQKCAELIYSQMDELYKYVGIVNNGTTSQQMLQKAINQASEKSAADDLVNVPTPHEIKDFLDQYVIGQDEAKIKIAVAVYNHYKRLRQNADDIDIEKSNMIVIGESGSGKCVTGDTVVTIRNKKTGEIENVTIDEFIKSYSA